MNLTLTEDQIALLDSYCERTGLAHDAALDDLLRRGVAQVDLRDLRLDVQDIRATTLDLVAAQDALAPYVVACLSVLAHWSVSSGSSSLNEVEYQDIALDTARAIWDALLAGRGIPAPLRPPAERSPSVIRV